MAETIRDFLVGLGFKVDANGQRRFTDAIRSATLQADLLARSLEGAAKAIAKAVADISEGFEQIYYTAQRAGTSVANIRSMTYALSQLGTSAGNAQSSLSSFGRKLATDPGAESLLQALGVRTRDARGQLRDTTKLFQEFGASTANQPTYVALRYAQRLGVDEDTMRALREQPELVARAAREQAAFAKSIGLNQDEAAKKGQEFMQSLRRLQMVVELVAQKILSDLAPALKAFVDEVIEWVRQNPDQIRDGIIAIGNAAAEFARALLAIARELAPVVKGIAALASAITGHGGAQAVMELFAGFMVASWAVRIVGAIAMVSSAWGALMLALGIGAGVLAVNGAYRSASGQGPKDARTGDYAAPEDSAGTGLMGGLRDAWRSRPSWLGGGGGGGGGSDRGGAGIRTRAGRAALADKTNYNFTGENADVLRQAAKELGTSPKDLATVISYESGFNSKKWGGKGGRYMGLIQFGGPERAQFGANDQQSFKEQMPAVVRYLKTRGFKPGMGLLDLYSTINAGRPGLYHKSDDGGRTTVADHVARMRIAHGARADRFLASGSNPQVDVGAAAREMGRTPPPTALDRAQIQPLGTSSTDNSRSASLTQHTTINVNGGGDPKETASAVLGGQKTVGRFGIEGIQSAIR